MGETINCISPDNNINYSYGTNSETKQEGTDSVKLYFTFKIRNDLFGIPVNTIREVLKYTKVFRTPRVPGYIKGVINLRGEVVPVINLPCRFYDMESGITENTSIIIIEITENDEKIPVGVMIDSVREVTELSDESIESTPEVGNRIKPDYIEGIGKVNGEFAILLKIEKVLKIDELSDFN